MIGDNESLPPAPPHEPQARERELARLLGEYLDRLVSGEVTDIRSFLDEHPERAIEYAVKGMMPRGPLGRKMLTKLRVFKGPDHTHAAQQPIPLDVNA